MTDLKGLIERLEAAPEGNRELDAELYTALWPQGVYEAPHTAEDCFERTPPYTTSLDAALTLIDKEKFPILVLQGMGPAGFYARVGMRDVSVAALYGEGVAPTPALALCIAALKARDALDGGNDEG